MRKFLTIFAFLTLAGTASIAHADTSISSAMPQNSVRTASPPTLVVVAGAKPLSTQDKAVVNGQNAPVWGPCGCIPPFEPPFCDPWPW